MKFRAQNHCVLCAHARWIINKSTFWSAKDYLIYTTKMLLKKTLFTMEKLWPDKLVWLNRLMLVLFERNKYHLSKQPPTLNVRIRAVYASQTTLWRHLTYGTLDVWDTWDILHLDTLGHSIWDTWLKTMNLSKKYLW